MEYLKIFISRTSVSEKLKYARKLPDIINPKMLKLSPPRGPSKGGTTREY
jgi:hypothetical protein